MTTEHREKVPVTELRDGDLIDLEGTPFKQPESQFEYAVVHGWDQETSRCIVIETSQMTWGVNLDQHFVRVTWSE